MNSGFLNWKNIILGTIAILTVVSGVKMMQTPSNILADVLVAEHRGSLELQIKFNIPVRYEDHTPKNSGHIVQIKVRPVSFSDTGKNEYLGSETILPGFAAQVPITDVAYEGAVPGGPLLTLRFSKPVTFTVTEDADFSSIILHLRRSDS
ncbi:MAG: hypothetical protein OEZ43_16565 [Gammaproteobacteria bacterium]|nr:hypothetical protein [Gammaproteobacteria bacterium]